MYEKHEKYEALKTKIIFINDNRTPIQVREGQ